MNKSIIFLVILIFRFHGFSQVYQNDLEKLNLKGPVKYVLYDKINFHYNYIFDEGYDIIAYEYYLLFNENKKLTSHGSKKKYAPNVLVIYPEKIDTDENAIYERDQNNKVKSIKTLYKNGFFKGKIKKSKTLYYTHSSEINKEYISQAINYKSSIDTTDLGYEFINFEPKNFSPEKHIKYHHFKFTEEFFDHKKNLIQIIYSDLSKKYQFEYNSNGDIIKRIDKNDMVEAFSYEYDKNNNWIKKTIICNDCNEENKIKDIITRKIEYFEN